MTKHILNDEEIKELAEEENMIEPFVDSQQEDGVVSYGLSSFGYDLRISDEFYIFTDVNNALVDPKNFDDDAFVHEKVDDHILIPPNSFALGATIERLNMPDNLIGELWNKSSYARCGIIINQSLAEPSWEGFLTVEISNTTPLPAKIYANEGIAQIVFKRGNRPSTTYAEKKGKYQNQGDKPEPAKVI